MGGTAGTRFQREKAAKKCLGDEATVRCVYASHLVASCSHSQQNACMSTSITIRDVPGEVRDELAARAAKSGRSLQEYLRHELIEAARRPDPAELMDQARERVQRTGSRLGAEAIVGHLPSENLGAS